MKIHSSIGQPTVGRRFYPSGLERDDFPLLGWIEQRFPNCGPRPQMGPWGTDRRGGPRDIIVFL